MPVNEAVLTTIAITGFGIAFFHAAMPTHWLPFVLTARVQRWNRPKTLLITALAGCGHVFFTALLGLLLTIFGVALNERIGNWFPRIAGGFLLLFGLYYLYRQRIGKGHIHPFGEETHHHEHEHGHEQGHDQHRHQISATDLQLPTRTSDRVAVISLLALLTFSPCEGFLPIYVSGIRYGWLGFSLLTAILSVATVAGMLVFTGLTLAGLNRIKLAVLEKYESALMGSLLCAVAILIIIFEK
jgi:nickel/cobalt transporter (NicO) family protein